jgi:hypothetical protein
MTLARFDAPGIALRASASGESGGTGEGHFGGSFNNPAGAAAVNARGWYRKEI